MNDKKTVLLADDVELFLKLEQTFLQRTGIDILTARDGATALQLVREHRPDAIFLDLYMPGLDGDACCRAIREDPELAGMAVVIVTSKGRPQDLERCREAGCDEVLLKPINRTEFLVTAERLLKLPTRRERFKARIQVEYGDDPQQPLTDFSVDLGSGGLYIGTQNPLPVGAALTVRFSLPGYVHEILCQAEVAWVNAPPELTKESMPPGMGVRFVNLTDADYSAVCEFVKGNRLEPSW